MEVAVGYSNAGVAAVFVQREIVAMEGVGKGGAYFSRVGSYGEVDVADREIKQGVAEEATLGVGCDTTGGEEGGEFGDEVAEGLG